MSLENQGARLSSFQFSVVSCQKKLDTKITIVQTQRNLLPFPLYMSNYSSTITKINQIEHIISVLPQYQSYFSAERHDWITPAYLQDKIKDERAFFETRQHLEEELSEFTAQKRKTKDHLETLTSSARYLLKAYLRVTHDDAIENIAFAKSSTLTERSGNTISGVAAILQNNPTPLVNFTDFKALKADLDVADQAFRAAKSKCDLALADLEKEKAEFMNRENDLEDLYHDLINAIEGVCHDDRDVLLKFMPWRVRSSRRDVA